MTKGQNQGKNNRSSVGHISAVTVETQKVLEDIDQISQASSQYIDGPVTFESTRDMAALVFSGTPVEESEVNHWADEVDHSMQSFPVSSRRSVAEMVIRMSASLIKLLSTNRQVVQQEQNRRFQDTVTGRLQSLEVAVKECCTMMGALSEQVQSVVQTLSQMQASTSHAPPVKSNRQLIKELLKTELKGTSLADSDDNLHQMVSMILVNAKSTDTNELERLTINFAYNLRETSSRIARIQDDADSDI